MPNLYLEDMTETAQELLKLVIAKRNTAVDQNEFYISFGEAEKIIASYLLDAYNSGYDAATLAQRLTGVLRIP